MDSSDSVIYRSKEGKKTNMFQRADMNACIHYLFNSKHKKQAENITKCNPNYYYYGVSELKQQVCECVYVNLCQRAHLCFDASVCVCDSV